MRCGAAWYRLPAGSRDVFIFSGRNADAAFTDVVKIGMGCPSQNPL